MADSRDEQIRKMQEQLDALKQQSDQPTTEPQPIHTETPPPTPSSSGTPPGCALVIAIIVGLWLSAIVSGVLGFLLIFIAPDLEFIGLLSPIVFCGLAFFIGQYFYKLLLPKHHHTFVHPPSDTSTQTTTPKDTKPHLTTEQWIGRHGLSYLGITLLVVGISFLIAYSLPFIGAYGRIGVGLIAALILLGLSPLAEKRSIRFGQLLFAGGIGTLYFTTYAMSNYDSSRILTGPSAAIINMALLLIVSAGSTIYTLKRYHTQLATVLSYLLIYLTVFIQGPQAADLNMFTVSSLLLASAGLAYLAWRKEWEEALTVGVFASYLGYWVLSFNSTTGHSSLDTIFLTPFFLCFSLPFLDSSKQKLRSGGFITIHIVNTLGYLLLLGPSLESMFEHGFGWLLIGVGAFNYLYGYLIGQERERQLQRTCFALANISLASSIPLLLTDSSVTISWFLIGAAMILAGTMNRYREFTWIGMVTFACAVIRFLLGDLFDPAVIAGTSITIRSVLGITGTVLSFGLAEYVKRHETEDSESLRYAFNAIALIMPASLISVDFDTNLVSLGWGVLGIAALLVGISRKDIELRILSFILLGMMTLRIFFVDLASAGTIMRVFSFIILGLILLATSWFYYAQQKKDGQN